MRTALGTVVCLILVAAPLLADGDPTSERPLTSREAADAVLAALKARDDDELAALARKDAPDDAPDPWLVADELCCRGEHDAAEAFSRAAVRRSTARLSAYVTSRRGTKPDESTRSLLRETRERLQAKDWKAAAHVSRPSPAGPLDSVGRVQLALLRAHALRNLRALRESARVLVEAGEAARELGWITRAAVAFRNAGITALEASDAPTAISAFETRRDLLRELGDREPDLARALNDLGIAIRQAGNQEAALRAFEESLAIERKLGRKEGIVNTLHNMGVACLALGRNQQALNHFAASLGVARERGDEIGIADALNHIGIAHARLGNHHEAIRHYEESLELDRKLGRLPEVADTLFNMGIVFRRLDDDPEALRRYEAALEIQRRTGRRLRIANALHNIAIVHARIGNHEQTIECFEESLEIFKAIGHPATASALNGLGIAQERLGRYAAARSSYEEALEIQRAQGNHAEVAGTLLNVGILQGRLGNYAKTFRSFEESLTIARQLRALPLISQALGNIAGVNMRVGRDKEALGLLEEELATIRELGDHHGIASALGNLGSAHLRLGDAEAALEHHRESLAIERRLGNQAGIAESLWNIASVYASLDQPEEALRHIEASLEIDRKLGNQSGIASALQALGEMHAQAGDHERARSSFEESLRILETTPSARTSALVATGLANLHLQLDQPEDAIEWAREGLRHVASLTEGLAGGEGAGARDELWELFEAGYRAALAASDPVALAGFLESGRAGSLRESIGARSALESAVIPDALLRDLGAARFDARRAFEAVRAVERGGDRTSRKKTRAEWDRARERVERVARRIEREAKRAASVVLPNPDDLEAIQTRLSPTEVLVCYALTSTQGGALVIRRDGADVVGLSPSRDIENAVAALLEGETRLESTSVETLRTLLIEPLGLTPHVRRLLISPTGRLGYVPFGMLLPEREVVYVPSGTAYGLLLEDREERGEKVLALGDPDYGSTTNEAPGGLRAGGVGRLPRLPATRREVEAIADVALLGKEASEAGLEAHVLGETRWRSIHFACHGLVDPERPMLSALALTADASDDGFLTALEIVRMKTPADLVVLSACDTAKGKIYKTEGILGLTHAFMYAGAPRVICSLWKVDDAATRALMVRFYELWNPRPEGADPDLAGGAPNKGLGAAAALKKAQAHVRDSVHDIEIDHEGWIPWVLPVRHWSHPRYWAAWVLWGLAE